MVLLNHWSSLIRHEEEGFPSNVGLSKPKRTTSATLGLEAKIAPTVIIQIKILHN